MDWKKIQYDYITWKRDQHLRPLTFSMLANANWELIANTVVQYTHAHLELYFTKPTIVSVCVMVFWLEMMVIPDSFVIIQMIQKDR